MNNSSGKTLGFRRSLMSPGSLPAASPSDFVIPLPPSIARLGSRPRGVLFCLCVLTALFFTACDSPTADLSSDKEITGFSFVSPPVKRTISGTNITVTVPFGTNLRNLTPTISHTGVSVSPVSGEARDFTGSIKYTITAVDSSSAEYTITVSVDNSLSAVTAIDSSNIANLVAMLTSVSGGNSAEAPLTLCSRPGDEQRRLERHILRGIEGRGQVRGALNLYACTADGHSEGGGLYAGKTVDPNREDTDEDRIAGKGYIVSLALPSRPQASRNDGA